MPTPPSISYLSMEPLREGHASYTHVMEITEGLRAGGCTVRLFASSYPGPALPGGWRRFLAISWVSLRFLVAARADLLYARWHFAAYPAVLWARIRGMKVVIEINGSVQDLFMAWPWTRHVGWLFDWLMNAQVRRADGVVAVTSRLLGHAKSKCRPGQEPAAALITNAANADMFYPGQARPAGLPERYAVFVGSMPAWKGVATMLAALGRPDWPAELDLVLAGDGAMRPEVEKAAAANPRLHYLGRLPYHDVPAVVANATMGLVMTANVDEGAHTGVAPLKLFEFMACGIPVIVTDVPGQGEIVRDGGDIAVLIEPDSPEALVEALRGLLADPERARALGQAGADWIRAEQSWAARARQTRRLIDRILA